MGDKMQFKKTDELRNGMRLARPIYNKNGVLLYERDSKLSEQSINSIRNFGLIGIFILEPAEPVPPMTKADIEFERFQTMCVFAIQEELNKINTTGKSVKLYHIVNDIIKGYGHQEGKINFIQNLRSKEDYVYKHSLNVAILCALMANRMNLKVEERLDLVTAAVLHDIGKLNMPSELIDKPEFSDEDILIINAAIRKGLDTIENTFTSTPSLKRICAQTQRILDSQKPGAISMDITKQLSGAQILSVAETFDTMTAMQFSKTPASEVETLKYLLAHEEMFYWKAVDALIDSINILVPGISVELNTGDKALVLVENTKEVLRPMVLNFRDNSIIDLSNKAMFEDLEIVDIMRTMDNRHIIDTESLKKQGFTVDESEYI